MIPPQKKELPDKEHLLGVDCFVALILIGDIETSLRCSSTEESSTRQEELLDIRERVLSQARLPCLHPRPLPIRPEQTREDDWVKKWFHLNSGGACSCSPTTRAASQSGLLVALFELFFDPLSFLVDLWNFCLLLPTIPLHLHITSGVQFWKMDWIYKGAWLIR